MKKVPQIALLFALMSSIVCCTKEHPKQIVPETAQTLSITTRSVDNQIMDAMRIYTFSESNRYFNKQLTPVRDGDKLTSAVGVGNWYISMVSAPASTALIAPVGGIAMEDMPLYIYEPTVVGGKSSNAPYIITSHSGRWGTPNYVTISADVQTTKSIMMGYNMAKVEIQIVQATPNFNISSTKNIVYLHNIPSTISYSGSLLPSKTAPDTLALPLRANLMLAIDSENDDLLKSNLIEFVIPAHQGSDFVETTPTDVTTQKMALTVQLEREDGTIFKQTVDVERVPLCNKTLRLQVKVTDMVQIIAVIGEKPWNTGDDTYVGGQFKVTEIGLGDKGFDEGKALDGGEATIIGKNN